MTKKTNEKLYAVAFGEDDIAGDSGFDATYIFPYNESMSKIGLLEAFSKLVGREMPEDCDNEEDDDSYDDYDDEPVAGYWVIDERTKKMLDSLELDAGGDDEGYLQNSLLKQIIKFCAVKTIKA